MDRLSELPLNIMQTILCLVPIQEAVRTSILAKEWRYRWTKIPNLVFDVQTFRVLSVDGDENDWQYMNSKLIYAAGQVLLMHDVPIHEFTLALFPINLSVDIDHIITHLYSRRGSIKKLTLNFSYVGYKLPSCVFSFHQLTHFCLIGGYYGHQPTSNEFGSLRSLTLRGVSISATMIQHLLSRSPLVKTLRLDIPGACISMSINDGISLISNDGPTTMSYDGPTITDLLECLPMIETLTLWFPILDVSDDVRVLRELSTPLFHLKYLDISHVCFSHKDVFIIAFLIKNSPNLEKLKIVDDGVPWKSGESFPRDPTIMLEHLNELEINDFVYKESRMDFVKVILARSPVLKKVRISSFDVCRDKRCLIQKILLGYSRASPEVQIIVEES